MIMNRESNIVALRPHIESIDISGISNPAELFQNTVLRPILKFQNDLLVQLVIGYVRKRDIDIQKLDVNSKGAYVTNLLQKDIALRNIIIGVVLGLMTTEEIEKYYQIEAELRNRTIKMVMQRLIDQL